MVDGITDLEPDCRSKLGFLTMGFWASYLNLSEPRVSHSVMGASNPVYSYKVSIRFT